MHASTRGASPTSHLAERRRAAGATPKLAERMAQLEYSAFLGAIQTFGLPSADGGKAFETSNALLLRALDGISDA